MKITIILIGFTISSIIYAIKMGLVILVDIISIDRIRQGIRSYDPSRIFRDQSVTLANFGLTDHTGM